MINLTTYKVEIKWKREILFLITWFNHYKSFIFSFLLVGTFAGALAVSYLRHWERHLNTCLQNFENEANELQVEWSQMLVEKNTWAALSRIQELAIKGHHMKIPGTKETVVVSLREIY